MLYGKTLSLPADFFQETKNQPNETEFIKGLRQSMNRLRFIPTTRHQKQKHFYVQRELMNSSHVFVRNDTVRPALQCPYNGPFEVIKRNDKFFKIKIKDKPVTISIDRLKPAFLETTSDDQTNTSENQSYTTRSGRAVKFVNYRI